MRQGHDQCITSQPENQPISQHVTSETTYKHLLTLSHFKNDIFYEPT